MPDGPVVGVNVPVGQWYVVHVLESGTVIWVVKDGKYEALRKEDILACKELCKLAGCQSRKWRNQKQFLN